MQGFSELPRVPEGRFEPPHISPRQGAANQDPAQGILLPSHSHRWADIQVAEGVEAGDVFPGGLAGHVAKIGALGKKGAVTGIPPGGGFQGKKEGLAMQRRTRIFLKAKSFKPLFLGESKTTGKVL